MSATDETVKAEPCEYCGRTNNTHDTECPIISGADAIALAAAQAPPAEPAPASNVVPIAEGAVPAAEDAPITYPEINPDKPHVFMGDDPDAPCFLCEMGFGNEVHTIPEPEVEAEPPDDPVLAMAEGPDPATRHAYEGTEVDNGVGIVWEPCNLCGGEKDSLLHAGPATEAEAADMGRPPDQPPHDDPEMAKAIAEKAQAALDGKGPETVVDGAPAKIVHDKPKTEPIVKKLTLTEAMEAVSKATIAVAERDEEAEEAKANLKAAEKALEHAQSVALDVYRKRHSTQMTLGE